MNKKGRNIKTRCKLPTMCLSVSDSVTLQLTVYIGKECKQMSVSPKTRSWNVSEVRANAALGLLQALSRCPSRVFIFLLLAFYVTRLFCFAHVVCVAHLFCVTYVFVSPTCFVSPMCFVSPTYFVLSTAHQDRDNSWRYSPKKCASFPLTSSFHLPGLGSYAHQFQISVRPVCFSPLHALQIDDLCSHRTILYICRQSAGRK